MYERLLSMMVIASIGSISRRWHKIDSNVLTRITLDIFMPPLIFLSILETNFDSSKVIHPSAGAAFVILGTLTIIKITSLVLKKSLMPYAMPIAFMNSGFLAFPVTESIGGQEWLSIAIIYDQMMNLIIFTIGLTVINTNESFKKRIMNFLLNPILASIAAAILCKVFEIHPQSVINIIKLPARATIPLALFAVGAGLADLKITQPFKIILGVFLRYFLGSTLGFLYCFISNIQGDTASVILISSTMPSAVLSFLLPARYGKESDYAAGVVMASTLIYPIVFPIVMYIIAR